MKITKLSKWDFWAYVTVGIIITFMVILAYPTFSLFVSGFKDPSSGLFSLTNFIKFFTKKYYYEGLIHSFLVSISVTLLSVIIGVPIGYFMTAFKIRGKRFLDILITISMLSPPFIGAYSWVLLLGRNGIVTNFFKNTVGIETPTIYGFIGILLVFTFKLFPYIYIYVSGALKSIDVSLSEAAESLGSGHWRTVLNIIMPLILPTILAGALLVFMNSITDFGTPMLIGEGYRVMPVLIYSEFVGEVGGSANFAAAMALIMVVITAVLFMMQKYIVNRKSYVMSSLHPMRPKPITGIKSFMVHAFIYIVVAIAIIPQLTVIYTSFLNTKGQVFQKGFSLRSYITIFDELGLAIKNTYEFGATAIVIIIILSMFIAYLSVRKRSALTGLIDTIAMLPYVLPGSVLGIALLLAFNHEPLILSGTGTIIVMSLIIRRLPYTLRSSSAILYQISPSLEEASISLGYSPAKTFFKITARLMMPGVISGAILSWITAITELSSSVILYTGLTKTMSVAIYTEVIRASYGTAAALSTILTITIVISLLIFLKISGDKEIKI
ncbi:MAG TPA: iron ABC transporter permease [Thermoanaerobacterales bacterium]|nr:iron ABC transporter permease [Thermoanaerobacterales bacterium]